MTDLKQLSLSIAICLCQLAVLGKVAAQDNGLFPITQDEKQGYIDKKGRVLIQPQFDQAARFHEGLARALIDGKWGYIDKIGKFVIVPQFHSAEDFSEGLAAIQIGPKHGYIDKGGKIVIEARYEQTWPFSEGLGLVVLDKKYGYVDKSGQFVVPPQFESAGDFVDGLGLIRMGGKYGYIDKRGKILIHPQFEWAGGFSEGLARFSVADKVGFIDSNGRTVIQPQFDSAAPFSEGLAAVAVGNKAGYINKAGKLVVEPTFVRVGLFSEGLAPVSLGSHGGYIDKTGRMVIENMFFDMGQEFYGGLALMETSAGFAYIDKKGNYVWKEKITPLPEIIEAFKKRQLTAKQKEHSKLYKEYSTDESLIDRLARAKRGEVVVAGKVVLASANSSPLDISAFLQGITCDADAIVEGVLLNESSQFTEDSKFMFTDYDMKVETVFKNNPAAPIHQSQQLNITKAGGHLKVADRTLDVYVGASVYPRPGERYLFFLRHIPSVNSYRAWINGSFLIRDDKIFKLSPNLVLKPNRAENTASEFLSIVRSVTGNECVPSAKILLSDQ